MEEKEYSVKDCIQWVKNYKMICLFTAIFVTSLIVFGNKLIISDTYQATALVSVKADTFKGTIQDDPSDRRDNVRVFSEEILSRYILTNVIEELELVKLVNNNTSTFQDILTSWGINVKRVPTTTEDIILYLQKNVEIAQSGGDNAYDNRAYVFTISLEDKYPEIASNIVNKIAEVYIASKKDMKKNTATKTAEFLSSEVDVIKKELTSIEKQLADYKIKNAPYLVPEETIIEMANDVRSSLVEVQGRAVSANSSLISYKTVIQDIPKYITSTSEEQTQVIELERELNQMLQMWKPDNPLVKAKQRELTLARNSVGVSKTLNPDYITLQGSVTNAQAEYDSAIAQITILKQELSKLTTRQKKIPAAFAKLEILVGRRDDLKEKYNVLSVKARDAEMQSSATDMFLTTNFVLVERANTPSVPVIPSRLKINIGGIIAGMVIGVLLAALLGFLTKDSNKQPIHRPVIAMIQYTIVSVSIIILICYIIMDYLKQSYIFG